MGGKPRLQADFRQRLWERAQEEALSFAPRRLPGLTDTQSQVGRRRRMLALSLRDDQDNRIYQIIHNEPTRFAPISEKLSMVRGAGSVEYTIVLSFFELGDNLPITRTKDEIMAAYSKAKSVEQLHTAFDLGSHA